VVVVVVGSVEDGACVVGAPDRGRDVPPPPPHALATRASATATNVSGLATDDGLRVEAEEGADVGKPVAVMAADGPVKRQPPRPAPASDGLGADPEEPGNF
jgi:hypothetical protein